MKTHNLAFIDCETSGLDPDRHEMIELAVVLAQQVERPGKGPTLKIIGEKDWKIKMLHPELAEEQALRVNGYNEADWIFAADLESVMKEFAKMTESANFVSHNLTFDYSFVMKAFEKTGVQNRMHYGKLDTISMAVARLYDVPQAGSFSLRALCELFKVDNKRAHTALADTLALVEVYKKMMGIRD
ncbi:MAG: polymerase subunit epsilon [Patescibacteria group bacterium]|nr:polymerase subunit epsilon [Patescibacteria group bacterium]